MLKKAFRRKNLQTGLNNQRELLVSFYYYYYYESKAGSQKTDSMLHRDLYGCDTFPDSPTTRNN